MKTNVLLILLGFVILIVGASGIIQAKSPSNNSSKTKQTEPSSSSTIKSSIQTKASVAKTTTSSVASSAIIPSTTAALLAAENANKLKVGTTYQFTATLFEEDTWGKTTPGYMVMVKAGNDDLDVYVEASDADNWQNGTVVKFTAEVKNDSKYGQYLKEKSATIISGGTTKAAKETAAQDKFYADMQAQVGIINQKVNMTLIDSTDKGAVYPAVEVHMSAGVADAQTTEIKNFVTNVNSYFLAAAEADGENNPQIHYYINDMEIGENRSILDPSQVKFNSNLN